jgi:hypothetical protein
MKFGWIGSERVAAACAGYRTQSLGTASRETFRVYARETIQLGDIREMPFTPTIRVDALKYESKISTSNPLEPSNRSRPKVQDL